MNPLYQRIITVIAGALAATLVQYIPGINEAHAHDVLSAILLAFAVGWSSRHPADTKTIPSAAIIQYEAIRNLGIDPTPRKPDEPAKGA